jgi:small nuclear ribonucleoprotein (snRNP)-like protein
LRSLVIVTLKGGSTFRGLLYDHDQDAVVLRNVEALTTTGLPPTPVDGELIVLMSDVLFLQIAG